MNLHYFALYSSVLLTAISQIMLKVVATSSNTGPRRLLGLVAAYGLLLLALGLNVYGLKSVPLSHMAYILPTTFVLVPAMSMLLLGEAQGPRFWLGSTLVLAGAVVFNLP